MPKASKQLAAIMTCLLWYFKLILFNTKRTEINEYL